MAAFNVLEKLRTSHAIFIFFLIFFTITNSGFITNADVRITYISAKTMLEDKTVYLNNVPENIIPQTITLDNGKTVAKPSIFLTALFLPMVFVGKIICSVTGIPDLLNEFLIAQFNSILGALSVLMFFKLLLFLKLEEKSSLFGSLCFGLLSLITVYAKRSSFEVIYMLLLISITYELFKYKESSKFHHAILASSIYSLMLLLKTAHFIFGPVILLGFLIFAKNGLKFTRLALFLVPPFIALALTFFANYIITGHPFMTTYGSEGLLFTTPFFKGLTGQLFSSEYGLLIYSPLTAICLISFVLFAREFKKETIFLGSLFLTNLFFYSWWFSPKGGEGIWGPRFLSATEFAIFIPFAFLFSKFKRSKIYLSVLLIFIAAAIFTQTMGLSIYERQYHDITWEISKNGVPQSKIVTPMEGHFRLLINKIRGKTEIYDPKEFMRDGIKDTGLQKKDHTSFEAFQSFSFWFIYAKKMFNNPLISKFLALAIAFFALFDLVLMIRMIRVILKPSLED